MLHFFFSFFLKASLNLACWITFCLKSSEPHHSLCFWRWRQLKACDQCSQWSCQPVTLPCLLYWGIFLNIKAYASAKVLELIKSFPDVQSCHTFYDDDSAGTGNICSKCSRNKHDTISWGIITQTHTYL